MNKIAIKVENLSKQYRIGVKQERYKTLRDSLTSALASPFRKARNLIKGEATGAAGLQEKIWALKNISLEVNQGEVVGIIGANGAGKTTLLKILSRITEPTTGYAETYGRVGSLLAVGTGFHPELTGRENIYLYGAILGMKKTEIERKFDTIVEFAGVKKFIDTPAKFYSSGMYVRLAFAVAAHLEPDILLVDEVLSVGDAEFQKKCLGKMGTVAGEGRTILFVSHNMVAVQNFCQRVVLLQKGKIVEVGEPSQIISKYLRSAATSQTEQVWNDVKTAPGGGVVRLHRVCLKPEESSMNGEIKVETPFRIEIDYWNLKAGTSLNVTIQILNERGIIVFGSGSIHAAEWNDHPLPKGLFRSVCKIPGNLLNNGVYTAQLLFVRSHRYIIYKHTEALSFEVMDSSASRGSWYGKIQGVIRPKLEWTTDYLGEQINSDADNARKETKEHAKKR